MNLRDHKEPKESGKLESREVKPKLIIWTSPKDSRLDAFGYYNLFIKFAETTPFNNDWIIHDECNDINL
jgi:hypothetical protein